MIEILAKAQVRKLIKPKKGYLIVDDTILDKPYSRKIGFLRYHWSGKHHRSVKGIVLITLLWTDGNKIIPVDFRIYDIEIDEKTKNQAVSKLLLIIHLG